MLQRQHMRLAASALGNGPSTATQSSTSSPKPQRKPTGLRRQTLTLAIAGALAFGLLPTAQAQVFPATINLGSLDGATGFRLDGVAVSDYSGRAVSAAGDVNGDGIDDLLIGADRADPNGDDSGSSYVVFGKSTAFAATLELSNLDGVSGFRLDGVAADDRSGYAVSGAGDVNGDGIDDLLIGADRADPNGSRSGSSYVVFGQSTAFAATLDLSSLDGTTGFRLDGAAAFDKSGSAVSGAGDVNGDGIDDLLVGAYAADPNGNYSGSSYVVFGKSSGFAATLNLSGVNGATGFRLDGVALNDFSGFAVSAAGDVNGDGIDDLLIGAIGADPNGDFSGSSYVVFGKSTAFAATLPLNTLDGTTGFRLDGVAANDQSGSAVSAAGDVNGDGIDDLLIGAFRADPNGDFSGSSYVVFGKSTVFTATLDLSTLNGTNGFRLDGVATVDQSGFAVSAAGDVNGDGIEDLLIGARLANPNGPSSGSSYVVFGKSTAFAATLPLSTLDGTTGFRLDGAAVLDRSGRAVSTAGDVNGDGIDDLLIGAYRADPNGGDSGSSYVVFGRQAVPAVSLTPSSVNIGDVLVGLSSAVQSVSIENTGTADLAIGSLSLSGLNTGDFALTSDTCSSQTIVPAGTCSFDVALTPSATGARSAQVDIPSNAPSSPNALPVTGNGVQAGIGIMPGSVDFGDVIVGQSSAAQSVSVENTGTGNLDIDDLSFSGANADDFTLSSDTCSSQTIAPAATCSFDVALNPSISGARSAQLDIPSNAPGSPDALPLTGNGLESTTTGLLADNNPTRLNQPALFTINVTGTDTAPADGEVLVSASTGESCSDTGPAQISGAVASFSCPITFATLGPRMITASFSASISHTDSDAAALPLAVMVFADLSISASDGQGTVNAGDILSYLIEVRNAGPDSAPGTAVMATTDPVLFGLNWSCTALNGANCPAATGSGMIAEVATLPSGGGLDYLFEGQLNAPAPPSVLLQAAVDADDVDPNFVFDSDIANNQSTDLNIVGGIFADQFE